jgi:PAS domain S-box-containing protein
VPHDRLRPRGPRRQRFQTALHGEGAGRGGSEAHFRRRGRHQLRAGAALKDGRKSTVSFNASVYRGADGNVQGIFASARDISEQARLQTQLVEQQAYNRSLIEASADALFAIAPDGAITDVNAEAARLTGYTRKHLVNSRFATYFTEPERAREGVQQTLVENRVIGYELTLITRHGGASP